MKNQATPSSRRIQGFWAMGFVHWRTMSMKPAEKPKPRRVGSIAATIIEMPVKTAWMRYSHGATNMKENSSGSVTPTKNEAIAAESMMP